MTDIKTTKVVALGRNIHTSQGKVLAGKTSKDIPVDEAAALKKAKLAISEAQAKSEATS